MAKRKFKLRLMYVLGVFFLLFAIFFILIYARFFASATDFPEQKKYLYVTSSPDRARSLLGQLDTGLIVRNIKAFEWWANKKDLWRHLKPGRYKITKGMSINRIVNLLRSGAQYPIKIVINKFRRKEDLAAYLGSFLEADSAAFMRAFSDKTLMDLYRLNGDTFLSIIIPNTYNVFWNTAPADFVKRCKMEKERFWNEKRRTLAQASGLTPLQVYIVASIVEEETNKDDEKPRVASVYLNRLKKGMKLEADPTARFCIGDFGVRRILLKHTRLKCPYNTYQNYGLPPGPICTPSIQSIEAVLNAEKTKYLFFCARPEKDGYHNFAATLSEHNRNARAFHKVLNKERIYK